MHPFFTPFPMNTNLCTYTKQLRLATKSGLCTESVCSKTTLPCRSCSINESNAMWLTRHICVHIYSIFFTQHLCWKWTNPDSYTKRELEVFGSWFSMLRTEKQMDDVKQWDHLDFVTWRQLKLPDSIELMLKFNSLFPIINDSQKKNDPTRILKQITGQSHVAEKCPSWRDKWLVYHWHHLASEENKHKNWQVP